MDIWSESLIYIGAIQRQSLHTAICTYNVLTFSAAVGILKKKEV